MSQSTTYNKAYLQSLNANKNSLVVDQLYKDLVTEVFNAAASGKTSHVFDMMLLKMPKERIFPDFNSVPVHPLLHGLAIPTNQSNPTIRYPLKISHADLLSGLQAKFPDCSVTLIGDENTSIPDSNDHMAISEIMNEWRLGTYVSKSGVLIDWS